ncbi:MAG: DNA polymerase IV [bacterium]
MGRSADVPRSSGQTDGDDSGCPILHVDMDAFYASVEVRRDPRLRGRPVIVGGGGRGVVSAASYEARRYGVRSAMPMSLALRRCPQAVVLPVDHTTYSAVSQEVMAILHEVTPLVEPLSLDEAFLDVSAARRRMGRPADIARWIRAETTARLQLTCSVGVAPTKFVAKVASARCKPDGLLVIPAADVLAFLHPLPVTALWGIGPSTATRLQRLGLRTVGDIAETPLDVLSRSLGAAGAAHFSALAAGHDPQPVETGRAEKSVSSDRTFDVDLLDAADVERELLRLAEETAARLRRRDLLTRTVGIKVRFADFTTLSRIRTLPGPVDTTAALHVASVELYRSLRLDRPRVRLLGVRAEGLVPAAEAVHQLSFDDILDRGATGATSGDDVPAGGAATAGGVAPASRNGCHAAAGEPQPSGQRALDRVADGLRTRFGAAAVTPASLLEPATGADRRPVGD